ncbi:MAG: hypothetical protein HYX67_02830 [Candidatus Melainabacteria bacterium]|nr:hypothetical protein [Candidatus Melainabacteria bacterium]
MRIFVIALILFIAYQAVLGLTHAEPGIGRDNYETNLITSENFRYLPKTPSVLIVGSSKTNFFNYDVLGRDIFHFGYGGGGALTGLEILNKSPVLPKIILVEVGDTLQWPADDHCVKIASDKFQIGDMLSSLQHRYQPCAQILSLFSKHFPRQVPGPEVRKHLVNVQRQQLSMPVPKDRRLEILSNCDRAKFLMSALKERGARVVAFDAPVETDVANSQYVSEVRTLVNQRFSPTDFETLTNPSADWHTRDGTHLMPESGKLYSQWLRKQIERLLGGNGSL